MSNNKTFLIAFLERTKNILNDLKLSECSDKSLYDVRVHTYEERNKHKECARGNHSIYLLVEDVSENYANNMENDVYYQCICLVCGRMDDFKISIGDRRRIVNTHLDPMTSLLSFYDVRAKYLKLKCEQLSSEEIAIILNIYYDSLQEKTISKTKIK